MRLYADLAGWWPLFSPPEDYVEEAADLLPVLMSATEGVPRTLLELGAGAGSLAHHLKGALRVTLTDLSPQMLAASRAVNPDCEHLPGDMRSLRLGREFDLVLVHDAICYATDLEALRATFRTAYQHCRRGGAAVFVPDYVAETFAAGSEHGGRDAPDGRGMRYLEWWWDPDPGDSTHEYVFAFLLRDADGVVRAETDRHRCGLFPRAAWLESLHEAGFQAASHVDPWGRDVFVARKA